MTDIYVHTLGDSTIDNGYWLLKNLGMDAQEARNNAVEGLLQKKLGSSYKVVSHAYDGFTTSSVLNGDRVGKVLGIGAGYPLTETKRAYLENRGIDPDSSPYFVHPLKDLQRSVESDPDATHYVVISVGGNDFRENLLPNKLHRLLLDIPQIHERYLEIVKRVKSLKGRDIRPILMFQYRLDAKQDHPYYIYTAMKVIGALAEAAKAVSAVTFATSAFLTVTGKVSTTWGMLASIVSGGIFALASSLVPLSVTKGILQGQKLGMATLGGLMEKFYKPILAQAKKDNFPILDLPNTFNPYGNLYISQIEPSKEGGELIAEGISHIVKEHKFGSSGSLLYSKRDSSAEFTAVENRDPAKWKVHYPSA